MSPVIIRCCFLAVCAVAASVPLMDPPPRPEPPEPPQWPATFETQPLWQVPLCASEERFHRDFPGAVARFTDGKRQFIFRWTTTGTRKLHSSASCFRGLGYRVVPETPRGADSHGAQWTGFSAFRGKHHLVIRERITDTTSSQQWGDVSAWYWSTLLRKTKGPWMAIAVIEKASSAPE